MFPFRLLKGVGRFCHCLQQREKDPAQGAEFENDTIKMASLKCQKEADKLYQGKMKAGRNVLIRNLRDHSKQVK